MNTFLTKVKLALRITTNAFDSELTDLIADALDDLGIAGVQTDTYDTNVPVIRRAVITYCKLHFGEPSDPVRLKVSYDEQKAQLKTSVYGDNYGQE